MARTRASLRAASLETEPLSARWDASPVGLTRVAPDENCVPYALRSKGARKSNLNVSCHKANKKVRKGRRDNHEARLEPVELETRKGKEETSPKLSFSSPSSVMRTRFGEDSLRLYKACLLPRDETELASVAHGTLEEIIAHNLMRAAAVAHQLTLQCTKWRKEAEESVKQSSREKEHATEARAQRDALEKQLTELKEWSEKAEQALLKSKSEIERLEQQGKHSFDAGRAAGRLELASSDEFRATLRQARASGAEDYLQSPTFQLILAGKAAEHELIGFMRCRSQILKLSGFREGFDLGLLDSGNIGTASVELDDDGGAVSKD